MCFTKQFVSLSYGLQILRLALSNRTFCDHEDDL